MNDTTLLLLHGLGANAGVWAGVIERVDWQGPVRALDLAGHGQAGAEAEPGADYTLGAFAAAVSASCTEDERTVLVGHSLGGVVALTLASGLYRPRVEGVVAMGLKLTWTDDDVAGMAAVAARGVRWFETRAEAEERFLRWSGLAGLVEPDHPCLTTAVVEGDDGWRVAQDPATFAQRPVDLPTILAPVACPIVLGAGADDAMVTADELRPYVDEPAMAPGRGHNVHVEDPDWLVSEIHRFAGTLH